MTDSDSLLLYFASLHLLFVSHHFPRVIPHLPLPLRSRRRTPPQPPPLDSIRSLGLIRIGECNRFSSRPGCTALPMTPMGLHPGNWTDVLPRAAGCQSPFSGSNLA